MNEEPKKDDEVESTPPVDPKMLFDFSKRQMRKGNLDIKDIEKMIATIAAKQAVLKTPSRDTDALPSTKETKAVAGEETKVVKTARRTAKINLEPIQPVKTTRRSATLDLNPPIPLAKPPENAVASALPLSSPITPATAEGGAAKKTDELPIAKPPVNVSPEQWADLRNRVDAETKRKRLLDNTDWSGELYRESEKIRKEGMTKPPEQRPIANPMRSPPSLMPVLKTLASVAGDLSGSSSSLTGMGTRALGVGLNLADAFGSGTERKKKEKPERISGIATDPAELGDMIASAGNQSSESQSLLNAITKLTETIDELKASVDKMGKGESVGPQADGSFKPSLKGGKDALSRGGMAAVNAAGDLVGSSDSLTGMAYQALQRAIQIATAVG